MENILYIFLLLLIGVSLKKVSLFPKETPQSLNIFIIYVSLPAVILLQFPKLQWSKEAIVPIILPWVALTISALIIQVISKFIKMDKTTKGALLLLVPLGNTSFLGIPMVRSFFGEQGIPYAVLYDQLGSFLALGIYGSLIVSLYSGNTKNFETKEFLTKVFTFPPFITLILATFVVLPKSTLTFLQTLAGTLVPLAIISVGMQLKIKLPRQSVILLAMGLGIKLVLIPLLALGSFKLLGSDHLATKVSIFESGMPPMISASAVAIAARLDPDLCAALVGIGIIISMGTLPLLYQIL